MAGVSPADKSDRVAKLADAASSKLKEYSHVIIICDKNRMVTLRNSPDAGLFLSLVNPNATFPSALYLAEMQTNLARNTEANTRFINLSDELQKKLLSERLLNFLIHDRRTLLPFGKDVSEVRLLYSWWPEEVTYISPAQMSRQSRLLLWEAIVNSHDRGQLAPYFEVLQQLDLPIVDKEKLRAALSNALSGVWYGLVQTGRVKGAGASCTISRSLLM